MGICFSDTNSELFGDTDNRNMVSKARRPSYTGNVYNDSSTTTGTPPSDKKKSHTFNDIFI